MFEQKGVKIPPQVSATGKNNIYMTIGNSLTMVLHVFWFVCLGAPVNVPSSAAVLRFSYIIKVQGLYRLHVEVIECLLKQ